ncbi:MAG: F0F1 ATP synthase subunit delta [Xanthobacteraceae bacterium]|nr:F0F1 ATP synthase subunit delta [Xanthobacteraceae bacterium]
MAEENPTVSGVAGRYATALFELALETNAVDHIRDDLAKFQTLLRESADLERLVRSPLFTADAQERALNAVLEAAGIAGTAANFLRLLARKRRLFAIADIIRDFNLLVASHKGEVSAQVTVAEPLSAARLAEVKAALAEVTGKDVVVDVKVDPSIIGGLVVKLGSRMIDTSLRTKLHALKNAMKEVG